MGEAVCPQADPWLHHLPQDRGRPLCRCSHTTTARVRVRQSRPFQTTGVDFACPLHVKTSDHSMTSKVWLCLYTCYTTRAVHLELVFDLSTPTFMWCFRRFEARRGTPYRMIFCNAETFKSAAAVIKDSLKCPGTRGFFTKLNIELPFNLERAPWWGGIFERMIKSAKRCLKKSIILGKIV